MNNHNHPNNEHRQDENPSGHILKRVLPHREDECIGTARYRSTTPTYQITIEHGSIRIEPECGSIAACNSCQHTDYQELRS